MRRTIHTSPFAIATFSMLAMTACSFGTDETGGRPIEVAQVEPVVATTSTNPRIDAPVAPPVATTPVPFADGDKAFRERRYDDATKLFGDYLESRPDNPWGHYMLGLSAWKSGDLVLARGALERSIELDPSHVKSRLNLARVLLEQGEPTEARTQINKAIELDSASSEAYRLLGRVHGELKQHDEAIAAYRLALSRDLKDVWSMNNMALILIQQRRFDEALGPLALAVRIDSTVPVFQNNLGITLEHLGQYTLATNAYRAAIAADSGYVKAVMSLARVEGRKEDPAVTPVDLAVIAEAFEKSVQ